MKYVKGISLFFVYPACCFVLGIMTGYIIYENQKIGTTTENNKIQQNVIVKEDVPDDNGIIAQELQQTKQEDESMTGQYVMNPNAVQEIPGTESVEEASGYFITIAEDCVIVYHGDKETVFLTTDIRAAELPIDVQEDLEDWLYVADEGMLYDFLENYTS